MDVSDEEQVGCSSSCDERRDISQLEEIAAPLDGTMPVEVNQEKLNTVRAGSSPDEGGESEEESFFDAVAEPMAIVPEQGDISLQALPVRKIGILDGDDAEVISDFLSKARAKRATNTPVKGDASVDRIPESPTPSARRVLKAVDGNSPRSYRRHMSPEKLQPPDFYFNRRPSRIVSSKPADQKPIEGSVASSSPAAEVIIEHARHQPKVPDQIPTRRRKGTEFVFMQRTDDQQTALLTKANTRLNKGSKPPHKLLPILNKAIAALGTDPKDDQHRHRDLSKKQVKWNDAALIEYCEERKVPEFDSEVYQNSHAIERSLRSSSRRNSTNKKEEQPPEVTENGKQEDLPAPFLAPIVKMPAPATPYRSTPVPRKMRKLVGAKHLDVHPNEGESPPVTRINLSVKTNTAVFPGTPLRHKKSFSFAQGTPRTLSLKPTKLTTSTSSELATSGSGSGSGSGLSYPTVPLRKQTKS